MAYKRLEMTSLIEVDPDKARARISAAYVEAAACLDDAAKLIGCSSRTIREWVAKLGLTTALTEIREEALKSGWHHEKNKRGGRPLGAKGRKNLVH